MSEAAEIELIRQLPAILAAVLGFVSTLLLIHMRGKVVKLEHNTNGMQRTIEVLAEAKGARAERDKEKP